MTASINRQEALHQFKLALKAGQKCYRDCVHRGRDPYPQVLEELLQGGVVAGRVDLGELEIPIAQIVGMNTAGRQTAFAANFMPLLDLGTEFASSGSHSARRIWATPASSTPSAALSIWGSFTCRRATSA